MNTSKNEVAIVGVGVMGANFARNGYRVGGYDRRDGIQSELEKLEPSGTFDISNSLASMVEALETPRRIVVLVPAQVVDDVIVDLSPLLDTDDIVVDAGNSLYELTNERHERAKSEPWRFVGMGVSGGAEGALRGPSMMPGGDKEAWQRLHPILESIAAATDSEPRVTHCGKRSAGHFVKMTHNGIEYGDMELIAEVSQLLRRGLGFSPDALGRLFSEWNQGELASFLKVIQAQHNYFKNHTYRRRDDPERAVHTDWPRFRNQTVSSDSSSPS